MFDMHHFEPENAPLAIHLWVGSNQKGVIEKESRVEKFDALKIPAEFFFDQLKLIFDVENLTITSFNLIEYLNNLNTEMYFFPGSYPIYNP